MNNASNLVVFGAHVLGYGPKALEEQCTLYMSCLTLLRTLHLLGRRPKGSSGIQTTATKHSYREIVGMKATSATTSATTHDTTLCISLKALSDPNQMRIVRDYLTSEFIDRTQVALNVCRCCKIEIEPVFAKWGLDLIKIGRLKEAREKFKGCLTKDSDQHRSERKEHLKNTSSVSFFATSPTINRNESSSISPSTHDTVQTIIDLLENQLLLSKTMAEMRQKQKDISKLFLNQTEKIKKMGTITAADDNDDINPKDSKIYMNNSNNNDEIDQDKSVLPPTLLNECLYYLKMYGEPLQLVKFYARHGMLMNATTTLVRHRLPTSAFTRWILDRYIARGHMRIFLDVMTSLVRSGDETIQTMRPYMRAACQWLENHRFFTWLHRLQSSALLSDHYGAARTCEQLFVFASDFDQRAGHLEQAREHYAMSMRESTSLRMAKLSLDYFISVSDHSGTSINSTNNGISKNNIDGNSRRSTVSENKSNQLHGVISSISSSASSSSSSMGLTVPSSGFVKRNDNNTRSSSFPDFKTLGAAIKTPKPNAVPSSMKSTLLSNSPSAFNRAGRNNIKLQSGNMTKENMIDGGIDHLLVDSRQISPPHSPSIRKQLLTSTNEKLSRVQQKTKYLENLLANHSIELKIEQIEAQLGVIHLVPWDTSNNLILIDVEDTKKFIASSSSSLSSSSLSSTPSSSSLSPSSSSSSTELQKNHNNERKRNDSKLFESGSGTSNLNDVRSSRNKSLAGGNDHQYNNNSTVIGRTKISKHSVHLLHKRMILVGQCVLFGQHRVGNQIARAFQLNVVECVANGLHNIMRFPNEWILARAMASGGSSRNTSGFDLIHHVKVAMERLRHRSSNWNSISNRIIDKVGESRNWWGNECRTYPPSTSSELLHLFGVSLGTNDTSMWPVTKLLVYTGQYKKSVEYVMLKKNIARPLLNFIYDEASKIGNEKAMKRCHHALLHL